MKHLLNVIVTSTLFLFGTVDGKIHHVEEYHNKEDDNTSFRKRKESVTGYDHHQFAAAAVDVPTHHLGKKQFHVRNLKRRKVDDVGGSSSSSETSCYDECDPAGVVLADYPQWQQEEGYWIGEYSLYQSDGTPFKSKNWNYRYDAYRGFITGNVKKNAYRQRNVFFYPPQFTSVCDSGKDDVVGTGICGVTGNTKIFSADQNATTCSTNPEVGGDIVGKYDGIFDTTTELIGASDDNSLLYQVYLFGELYQSQLTTLSVDAATGQVRRTRSAQSFSGGVPVTMSFYRERKVDRDEFYNQMQATAEEYNIQVSDTCTWKDNFDPAAGSPLIDTGLEPGVMGGCMSHLEESFEL